MKSVLLSQQKTLVVKGANTFDHAFTFDHVFTSRSILVIYSVTFGETNCCFSCVELLKISRFGYFIKKPSKVCEFCLKTNNSLVNLRQYFWP